MDLVTIWQKAKLVLNVLKFPKWIFDKVLFLIILLKFKKLPQDKQEFLFKLYENLIPSDVWFFEQNKTILKCLEIDGFIKIVHVPSEETELL